MTPHWQRFIILFNLLANDAARVETPIFDSARDLRICISALALFRCRFAASPRARFHLHEGRLPDVAQYRLLSQRNSHRDA